MNKNINKLEKKATILLFIIIIAIGLFSNIEKENKTENIVDNIAISYETSNIPEYNGKIYIQINNNVPTFSTEDMNIKEDYYSTLENGKVRHGYDKN